MTKEFSSYYFLGIGGIGMSALAKYFLANKKTVFGYDKTKTTLTEELEKLGISIEYLDEVEFLPREINPKNTIVVFTPAIPKDSKLYNYFLSNHYILKKRSEILGEISSKSINLSVAGTHGKTTTSSILAHILYDNKIEFSGFLGGILNQYNSNYLSLGDKYSVTEADEFDRSFLRLKPQFACITSTDADHLDIYGDKKEVKKGFDDFAKLVEKKLFVQENTAVEGISYGFSDAANCKIKNIRIEKENFVFDLEYKNQELLDFILPIPGKHNVQNATAAILLALELDLSAEKIKKSLSKFPGVKRRFSIHKSSAGKVYVDDYAHHPTELDACIDAARTLYSGKKILGIFQPHLFSRTRDFAEGFAKSLSNLDELILLEIYPAREKPIEGINSDWLLEKVNLKNKRKSSLEKVLDELDVSSFDVLMTMGAGDIDLLVEPIKNLLK